jgi:hypothetical protein
MKTITFYTYSESVEEVRLRKKERKKQCLRLDLYLIGYIIETENKIINV